jgi:hypothetical protein
LKPVILDIAKGQYNYSLFTEEYIRLLSTLRPNYILLQGETVHVDGFNDVVIWESKQADNIQREAAVEKLSSAGSLLKESVEIDNISA